jgi:hypothetical protein
MQNCSNRLSGRWESILWFVKDIKNYIFNLDDGEIDVEKRHVYLEKFISEKPKFY